MARLQHLISALPLAAAVWLGTAQGAWASVVTYNFESLSDAQVLTSQIGGLSFGHAMALSAGGSLNEFAFPPHSGSKVLVDDGGAISIEFSAPIFSAGAYFTYVAGLTLSAYDSSSYLLGTVSSAFGDNSAGGSGELGSSPNEFLSLGNAAGLISRLVITGDPSGGSFVMDDLTLDLGVRAVPEPGALTLALAALLAGGLAARRRRAA